ncbi:MULTISPECIES: DUF3558 family protein [Amycolatopsis]|uniref:DUF3558 family protein n=1 Tax=Amycolatopsis albidoflavus TaxID=102226 RepID=A0ABW5I7G9_9PSEU
MNRTRPARFLPAAALASLAACGSPENSVGAASPTPPPGSVSMSPSARNFTGADLCALLTDADKQVLGLAGPGEAWDRPYKMGGSRRARCRWTGDDAELDLAFHDADIPKDSVFPTEVEVSREQIHGRDAKVVAFQLAPMNCDVLVDLRPRAHLSVDSTPVSDAPDQTENCAFARRIAEAAASRIPG